VCVNLLVSALAAAGAVRLCVIAFRMQTGSRAANVNNTLTRCAPCILLRAYNQLLSRALCKTSFKFLVNENQRDLT
jgi:hypothetical protein